MKNNKINKTNDKEILNKQYSNIPKFAKHIINELLMMIIKVSKNKKTIIHYKKKNKWTTKLNKYINKYTIEIKLLCLLPPHKMSPFHLWPLLLTWFNLNPSMDK